MSDVGGLRIGAKVTVITSDADPVHLCCHPHTVIAEVIQTGAGPVYMVEHAGEAVGVWPARRWGPFPAEQLTRGWS